MNKHLNDLGLQEIKREATVPRFETRGIWDERSETWIRPSGTVKQGRRPMFQPFKNNEIIPQ